MTRDELYMKKALELAKIAAEQGEVPVGAIVVKRSSGEIIGRGFNRREYGRSPLTHAELVAIEEASRNLGGWRLMGCELFVTLEPCPMCTGAIINSRIGISADSYTKAKVYVSSSGGTAEEIDCFEAKDADSAKAIADTLTARVESQKKVFENYVPEEMTKLNDPVLVTNGNYVYLCLSNDNDKAKEIIG